MSATRRELREEQILGSLRSHQDDNCHREQREAPAFATGDAIPCDARSGQCHLCGDEALVGRVLDVDERGRTATVAFSSGEATVAMDFVDANVGDDVLVHLGFAIERVTP